MKKDLLTGKQVSRIEHMTSNKVKVYFTDASSEVMDSNQFKLRIKTVRG